MKFNFARAAGLAVLGLVSLQLGACATIVRGTKQKFTIESSPPAAKAETSLGVTCTTPCTLKVDRKTRFSVTVSKDGYETQTVPVGRKVTAEGGTISFGGNWIIGGAIGMGIDAGSGAMFDLWPNPLVVTLKPKADAPAAAPAAAEAAPAATPAVP
jgi:hypothetical protein